MRLPSRRRRQAPPGPVSQKRYRLESLGSDGSGNGNVGPIIGNDKHRRDPFPKAFPSPTPREDGKRKRETLAASSPIATLRQAIGPWPEACLRPCDIPPSLAPIAGRNPSNNVTVIGNAAARTCGRWLNNRAENSHQPFRRREAAMANFRNVKTLQKFTSVHASIHNHFSHERHLNRRDIFKQARAAALAEWRQLAA